MKTAIAIITAGAMSLGIVAPAAAFHLNPENTTFTGKGKTSATKNGISLPCKANFKGHVDQNGVGFVDSGSFKGQIGCSSVTLANLPWEADATGKKTVILRNVQFSTPIGDCGPGDLETKLVKGVIKFTADPLPGGCTVSGKITTSPTVSIVK